MKSILILFIFTLIGVGVFAGNEQAPRKIASVDKAPPFNDEGPGNGGGNGGR